MKENETIELIIEDMLDDGRAFGRHDGFAVFVDGGVPGDRITAKVLRSKKSSCDAKMTNIVEPSPDRVSARCPYYGKCGGCTLQELSYEAQKKLKENQLRSKLRRLGGLESPLVRETIGAETLDYYRNKATFAVGPHGEVGFVRSKSHWVIDIEDCLLQTDAAMVCADALRAWLRDAGGRVGITHLVVKTAFGTGEVMAVLYAESKKIQGVEKLVEMLDDAVYSLDSGNSLESVALVHQGKTTLLAGKPTITEEVSRGDGRLIKYEISTQSFYQVNPEQMPKLYDKVLEYSGLGSGDEGEGSKPVLLDLYCGIGTIGIWLADKAKQVIGIETVKPAVIDANRNSVINGLVNTRYICGKAEEELPGMMGLCKLYKWNEVNERVEREPVFRLDELLGDAGSELVAVLDPPRAGCDEALLEAIAGVGACRIVYVSCDPGTLARDMKYLVAHGYEFVEATPVDQFPMTSSIESVSLLVRK